MTKINNDSVSQCLLHCLKQTKLKYDEALVHSDGLSNHGTFLMWKITKMWKRCPFFFSRKFCITRFINSLLQNVTVGFLVYSQPDFVTVSSVIKRGKRRSKRKVFGQLKPLQCLNVKAGRQCLKLQKIKRTRKSYGGSEVFIYLM